MALSPRHITRSKPCSAEDGFTLIELLLASVFMIFVITLVYQTVSFAQIGAQISARNNVMSGDVGTILDIEDRFLSQNLSLTKSGDYAYDVEVPRRNGTSYYISFMANSDGTFTAYRRAGTSTTFRLSKINANRSSGTPLLELFDSSMNVTTDMTKATSAKITIVAKDPSGNLVSSSRTVLFRNR